MPKLLICILFLYDYNSLLSDQLRREVFHVHVTVESDDISKYFHLDEHLEAEMSVQLIFSDHSDRTYS